MSKNESIVNSYDDVSETVDILEGVDKIETIKTLLDDVVDILTYAFAELGKLTRKTQPLMK